MNRSILLVEDNPSDLELTLRAFRKNHIQNEVIVAHNGAEALDYLFKTGAYSGQAPDDLPQLVILDLKLPKIGGLEVLKRLRENEHTRYLPVVILTSSTEDQDLVEGYRLGTNAYVKKPVDFMEFTEAVKQLGMFWLLLNQQVVAPLPAQALPT